MLESLFLKSVRGKMFNFDCTASWVQHLFHSKIVNMKMAQDKYYTYESGCYFLSLKLRITKPNLKQIIHSFI